MERGPTHMLMIEVGGGPHAAGLHGMASVPRTRRHDTERLLALLAEEQITATFFVVGRTARRSPGLVRRIAEAGHELASHSFWHAPVRSHDLESFSADVAASKRLLEDLSGHRVYGFRASGGISAGEVWAFDALVEHGYAYDVSLPTGGTAFLDDCERPSGPYRVRCHAGTLVEVPLSPRTWGGRPRAGGRVGLLTGPRVRTQLAVDRWLRRPSGLRMAACDPGFAGSCLPGGHDRRLRALFASRSFGSVRMWLRAHLSSIDAPVLDVRSRVRTVPAPDPARIPPLPREDPARVA